MCVCVFECSTNIFPSDAPHIKSCTSASKWRIMVSHCVYGVAWGFVCVCMCVRACIMKRKLALANVHRTVVENTLLCSTLSAQPVYVCVGVCGCAFVRNSLRPPPQNGPLLRTIFFPFLWCGYGGWLVGSVCCRAIQQLRLGTDTQKRRVVWSDTLLRSHVTC